MLQEKALLPVMPLQPQRTCGSGEPYTQKGQGAFDCVLDNGHPVMQEHFENHWCVSLLPHHRGDCQASCLSGEAPEAWGLVKVVPT